MSTVHLDPARDALWSAIADRGRTVVVRDGTPMLQQGELGRHCYAIVAGEVAVTATTSSGATVVLARRGAGTIIGELAALDAAPRSATATARGEVTAVVLTASELESLLRERPELAIRELRRLSRQLRSLTERFALRSEELRVRLAGLLLTHLDVTGDPALRSTRQELADWVGATREAVTRSLRQLEDEGLVELGRSVVRVIDRPGLSRRG